MNVYRAITTWRQVYNMPPCFFISIKMMCSVSFILFTGAFAFYTIHEHHCEMSWGVLRNISLKPAHKLATRVYSV